MYPRSPILLETALFSPALPCPALPYPALPCPAPPPPALPRPALLSEGDQGCMEAFGVLLHSLLLLLPDLAVQMAQAQVAAGAQAGGPGGAGWGGEGYVAAAAHARVRSVCGGGRGTPLLLLLPGMAAPGELLKLPRSRSRSRSMIVPG